MTIRMWLVLLVVGAGAGCASAAEPAEPALGQEACAFCRMTVSQREFVSQVQVPGELPLFFDDLGCLNSHLTSTPKRPPEAAVFVTDHRSRKWIRAEDAVFSRVDSVSTPMGSHLVAHASRESRSNDGAAAGATPVARDAVIPPAWQVRGKQP
jgi:copper chaperone NosL